MVTEVQPQYIVIKNTDSGEKTQIPFGALLWVTGNAQRSLTKKLISSIGPANGQTSNRGILVDDKFRVKGATGVWALGDCTFTGLSATAQVASQSGKYLGQLFNNLSEVFYKDVLEKDNPGSVSSAIPTSTPSTPSSAPSTPSSAPSTPSSTLTSSSPQTLLDGALASYKVFSYTHVGSLAYVGDYQAIMELKKENKITSFGVLTWLWWRSVYFSKLLSLRNRVSVVIDWTKALIFGRDISRG